ncbi:hypothetical protein GCM10027290_52730 [Micromonospora sonneratiae]
MIGGRVNYGGHKALLHKLRGGLGTRDGPGLLAGKRPAPRVKLVRQQPQRQQPV